MKRDSQIKQSIYSLLFPLKNIPDPDICHFNFFSSVHLNQPNSWLRGIGYIALIIMTVYFLNACRTIDGGSTFHFPQPSSCASDSDTTPLPTLTQCYRLHAFAWPTVRLHNVFAFRHRAQNCSYWRRNNENLFKSLFSGLQKL